MPKEHIEIYNEWKTNNPDQYNAMSPSEKKSKMMGFKREILSRTGPERNVERAIRMQQGDPSAVDKLRAMQQGPEQFGREIRSQAIAQTPYKDRYVSRLTGQPRSGMSARAMEAISPRTMEGLAQGEISPVGMASDALSLGGRAATSGIPTGEDYLERVAKTEGTGLVSDILRDPLLPISGGMPGQMVSKGLPLAKRAIQYGMQGMKAQAPITAAGQAEKVARGEDLGFGESALEITAGGALPLAGRALKKTFTPIKEFTKDVMSEASGRSKELLNTIGGRELKEWARKSTQGVEAKPDEVLQKLRNFSDNATKIADDVIKTVDNFDVLYREKDETINKAIAAMPDMDANPLLSRLSQSKYIIPRNSKGFENEVAFNNQIDGLMNRIQDKVNRRNPVTESVEGIMTPSGAPSYDKMGFSAVPRTQTVTSQGSHITAEDMLDIRRDIDKAVDWNNETFSKSFFSPIQKFKKDSRTYIKDALEESAEKMGDKSYAPAMKEYSKILTLQDKVKRQILPRANDLGEVDRATNFLLRLSAPNKLDAQMFAKNFEQVLGKDLFKDADFLRLSKEYRDALPIANDIKTGRKNWLQGFMGTTGGKIATAPLSSSKIVAPIMGAMDVAERGLGKWSPQMSRIQQGLTPIATEQYIGE